MAQRCDSATRFEWTLGPRTVKHNEHLHQKILVPSLSTCYMSLEFPQRIVPWPFELVLWAELPGPQAEPWEDVVLYSIIAWRHLKYGFATSAGRSKF